MKILVTGSSGFVGSKLVPFLRAQGNEVFCLVRNPDSNAKDAIFWDVEHQKLDPRVLEGFDAVINLAGENVASGFWTKAKKERIAKSRIQSTQLLSHAMVELEHPPKIFVCASAVGYYGNRGDQQMNESDPPGKGFLADVCIKWEEATKLAQEKGVRVVHLRFGVILSAQGGMLAKLLPLFRFGLGGKIGSGKQYMSWISLQDVFQVIQQSLINDSFIGAFNVVAPEAVTNAAFTHTLGKILNRPTFFSVPTIVAKTVFGEMADEMLLTSTRAVPHKLMQAGFVFQHPTLEPTLRELIKGA